MGRRELPTPEKYCERCGKKLERRPLKNGYLEPLYWFNKRRFCSVRCANVAKGEMRSLAPVTSAQSSRSRARKKVGPSSCSLCGKEGYTEVHHIDENPMNNDPSNLIRLCKSCHALQHAPEKGKCVVCGLPVKGHGLCSKHWQAWRKSIRRGWDTEYTLEIKRKMEGKSL